MFRPGYGLRFYMSRETSRKKKENKLAMPGKIYIGCSGFHYKEWKNVFYPEGLAQAKWFQFYCEQFNTLEINSTFYKFPTAASLQKWYNTSPEDFKFSVKAPRVVTHFKRFNECERYLSDFYNACKDGLKEKLGCILFQLPPQLKYSKEMLDIIITSLDLSFKNVLEFRDESWCQASVFTKLGIKEIIVSGISHPKLPDPVIVNANDIYYRFHGVPVLYKSAYNKAFLDNKINEIKNSGVNEAWIYFNNTWGTAAIENGKYIQKLFRNT